MPVVSTEETTVPATDESGPQHPRLRSALRWLPGLISALVFIGAVGAVVQIGTDTATSGAPHQSFAELDAPLLSLRRDIEPLRQSAADRLLRAALDDFVASQPPDTCLQVRIGDFAYDHRVDDPQTPASLQKLLTAVAALEALDPAERFTTEVTMITPPIDGVVGDIFLRGGGDPLLATAEYMARERNQPQVFTDIDVLADQIVAAGVRTVAGAVVGDESRYDTVRYNPAWPTRFVAQGQAGPLTALSVNDGFAHFVDGPGLFGAAEDPAAYGAEVLALALQERGVTIGAPSRSGPTPPDAVRLAAVQSPPLVDVVAQMLRESDNNTAELLVKELGFRQTGVGSTEAGVAAVTATLGGAGIDVTSTVVLDGSGLAPGDQVTCELVSELLTHPGTADAIEESLAVAGETGTLTRRFARPEVAGQLRAKTGTLNQVTSLAGLAETGIEDRARFSLMANVAADQRIAFEVVAAQERLADLLVGYPQLPDVDHLRPG